MSIGDVAMYPGFDEGASKMMTRTYERMPLLKRDVPGTEDMLAVIVEEKISPAYELIEQYVAGGAAAVIRSLDAFATGESPEQADARIRKGLGIKRYIQNATDIARSMNDDHVGSVHLLLAIAKLLAVEPEGVSHGGLVLESLNLGFENLQSIVEKRKSTIGEVADERAYFFPVSVNQSRDRTNATIKARDEDHPNMPIAVIARTVAELGEEMDITMVLVIGQRKSL